MRKNRYSTGIYRWFRINIICCCSSIFPISLSIENWPSRPICNDINSHYYCVCARCVVFGTTARSHWAMFWFPMKMKFERSRGALNFCFLILKVSVFIVQFFSTSHLHFCFVSFLWHEIDANSIIHNFIDRLYWLQW